MSDTKQSLQAQGQPPEKPTVKDLDIPPAWAISFAERLEQFRRENNANHTLVLGEVRSVQDRVGALEQWRIDTEGRQEKHSSGVRQLSETDAKHGVAIANVIERVDRIEGKLDELAAKPDTAALVLAEMKAAANKPWAKKLGAAILPVLLLAISAIGVKLQMAVTKLEEKPAAVQPAPTVYLPAPTLDGGAP